jgi:hypothetical protein
MMKNVVAEAKIEGGLVKINATKELIDQYVAQNGKQPEGKDLKDIEEIATKEAYRTAALNLPAIGVTNRLMYATMLAPLRNVMGKEAVPLLEDIIFNKKTFSALGEGLVEKGSAALKSLSKPKFYGQFGMNYLKANFAEGIQENLQEAISYGAIQHAKATYNNPVRAAHDGYMTDLMDGLRQQFSAQGAETFASGFLMGAFAQPIMALPSVGISRLVRSFNTEKYEQEKQLKKDRIQRDIDILNEQYQSPLEFYAPDLANSVKTGSLADDMYAAGKAGNKKEAMDAQDAIQNQHMITAFRTGKYDIIRKRLADYENFTAEETIEAFKKYGIEEKDYEKASAKIKEVIARADRIKEVYENVAKKYPNPINVSNYKRGTPEREAAEISKMAWDEAVSNLVFAHATMDSHSKRIADIAKTFSAISNDMAGEDAQSLMSMLSTTTLAKEVVALANEVKVLDDNIPAQKKIKAKKEKQLEKIDKYFSAIKDIEEAKTPEEKAKAEEKAKDAFGDYVKFLANKNEKLIFDDSLEDAYNMVRDSMLLKNDMKGLVDSINVLMTPQNFLNLHARLYNAHEEMFKNRESIINNNVNLHHEIKDTNDAINLIYQENKLNLSPESLDAIKEAKDKNENLPANITFVDEDGNAVTSGPRFENAMKTWKVLLDLTKKEAKPVEEEIEEEETEEFDPEDVSTYPDSLMNDLEDMYELYKESSLIDEGDTFDMFLKTQTAKVIIKNAELAVKLQEERKEKKPDLLQRINNAGTPEELDEIDAEIQKAGALTKELIDATNKKRESFKKTTTTPTDIKDKKADIINKLFEKNILTPLNNGNTWMLDGDGRIFVVANINGNKVLFYTSSEGTSGKTEGAWYPVIGISNTGYIIKGTKDSTNSKYNFNEGYGIKEIKDFKDFLNRNITNVKGKDLETLKSIFGDNVETNISYKVNKEFDLAPFINSTYKVQDKKLTFGGYLSREEAIDIWLDRFKAKEVKQNINAELAALESKPAEKTGIPLTITSQVRQQLYDLGYNKQDVDAMKPEDAKQIIDNQVTKKTTKYKKPRKKKTKDGKQLTIDLEGPENINENYKGAIIYMTPSSIVDLEGYPTVMNTDDISIDFIIEQVPNVNLKWYAETYKNEHNWKSQVIYDAIAHMGVDGNKLREKVSKRAKELAAEGNTVLTGSNYYVKDADYVMIQTNPEINKNMPNYPIQNAIYEAKVENKPVILINQMFNEALKQTPQELSDKDLEFINEDSEITIEDINKKITQKGLYIARDRGYDVFYKNKRYAIVNISGNSVSLSSIDGEKINVKVSEISSVVDPTGGQASKSDISTFKNNENNIQSGKVNIDFEEKNINKVIKDIEDNIC